MIDPKEALKHIRTLAEIGSDSETPELMVQHFNEILKIVEKALAQDTFQARVGEPPRS
jgi:Asp-tRNA(Asn)/Glu-tRNA(Gln) amidotransferase C subunit